MTVRVTVRPLRRLLGVTAHFRPVWPLSRGENDERIPRGTYQGFACIEMDDAIIGKVCAAQNVAFGFVRNVSDPVQNAQLPAKVQGNWGSTVYDAYGYQLQRRPGGVAILAGQF
jgi:hypothetical protein